MLNKQWKALEFLILPALCVFLEAFLLLPYLLLYLEPYSSLARYWKNFSMTSKLAMGKHSM